MLVCYLVWWIACLLVRSALLSEGFDVAMVMGAGWVLAAITAMLVMRRIDGDKAGVHRIADLRADTAPWWSANPVTVSGAPLVAGARKVTGAADRGALLATNDGLLFVPGRVEYPACQLPWSDVREIRIADHGRAFAPGFIVGTTSGEVVVKTSKGPLLAERWTQPEVEPPDDNSRRGASGLIDGSGR